MKESLLFMGHGSRDFEAVDECMSMVSDLEQELGQPFTPGFLELSKPLLFPEIVRQIDEGVRRFLCFPNMLLPGRHTMDHLPGVIGWAQRHFPEVEFYYGNFIGNHPYVLEILYSNYRQLCSDLPGRHRDEETAVVVVGRGSTSSRSNRTFEKMVDRFQQQFEIPNVTYCYVSLAEPGMEETFRRLAEHGQFENILLLPYFLFTGVLIKRIRKRMNEVSQDYPNRYFAMGDYFGKDERLKEIISGRIRDLADQSVSSRPNKFVQISQKAGHHLHHLDVFGDEPAAPYLQDIPGCPEHRHPSKNMEGFEHGHLSSNHK
ncbi:MAG: sirohydrochlorin chelatase [bacterium]